MGSDVLSFILLFRLQVEITSKHNKEVSKYKGSQSPIQQKKFPS